MPLSDGIPSSPPGPSASSADAIAYYKTQYESLEAELADFQTSSKELEAELEKDIEASEKRERQLKEKADNLTYEVVEWKTKYKQAKSEAGEVQNTLQKEITTLRDANRTLQLRLRDTEVANDDYERQQRNTESSLEDLESKYSMAIERSVMMEEEVKAGEQERETLRIDAQRLRDELSDLKIEADIIQGKLRKVKGNMEDGSKFPPLESIPLSTSPRSELSPTTTDSSPSFDTPPGKTVSSSGLSDTHTPPSPPISERSTHAAMPPKTPGIPKTRISINSNNTTPRPSTYGLKPPGHTRGPSISAASGRSTPSTNFRQSISRPSTVPKRPAGLPQSNSIYHLHNLQGKMQRLTERVHTAKSKLPAPAHTSPRSSPRTGSTLASNIPATVTLRSNRKRVLGSAISGSDSLLDPTKEQDTQAGTIINTSTPSLKPKPSRQTLTMPPPTATPTRAADRLTGPFARPSSRASASTVSTRVSEKAKPSPNPESYQPGHSRSSSRASISMSLSNVRTPLGSRTSQHFTPNASTDRIRPKSSLSNYGHDGAMDEEDEPSVQEEGGLATPTPRRTTFGRSTGTGSRLSDVSSAIPVAGKRSSISRLPAPMTATPGRMSLGGMMDGAAAARGRRDRDPDDHNDTRPSSSRSNQSFKLGGLAQEQLGDETF